MVKNLLSLLSRKQNSILSGAVVLMLTIMASKVLGLLRDRLLSSTFSPSDTAVFLASFRLPDLVFQLLIFGALSVAFIPVFSDYIHQKSEKEAFDFASEVFNVFIVAFCLISIIIFFFITPLTRLIVPGFSVAEQNTTALITRIILAGQILLAIGSFFASIAQSFQRFIIPALAGAFYNIGIILGIVFLSPFFGIFGPAWGVIAGGILYILAQIPLIYSLGFRFKTSFNPFDKGVQEIFKLIGIRTIGLAVEQINETIGLVLASLVSTASVTYLTFAQHLQTVPISLFGLTLAQAAFPVLSREHSTGEMESFKTTILDTFNQILFLTLPATAMLVALHIPAVRLVFGASQFDWDATVLTGRTMAFLALGLAAQSLSNLFIRGFYAIKDTKTPVIVSILTVVVDAVLSIIFVVYLKWEVWSLGLAYAISSNISIFLLIYFLSKKVGGFKFKEIFVPFFKMFLASVATGIVVYLPIRFLSNFIVDTTRTVNLLFLTSVICLIGLCLYVLLARILKVKEVNMFTDLFKKIMKIQPKVGTEDLVKDPGGI